MTLGSQKGFGPNQMIDTSNAGVNLQNYSSELKLYQFNFSHTTVTA